VTPSGEALNQVVQQFFEDGDDRLEPLYGLIDAIRDKIDAAEKMIEKEAA
jgi:hypothetical protein